MFYSWDDFVNHCKREKLSWSLVSRKLSIPKENIMEWAINDQVPESAMEKLQNQNELTECIDAMQEASDRFYHAATRIHNHPFIEFTGLMNEYIKVCEHNAAQGRDFRQASRHTEQGPLELHDFQVSYIREKLECIYGEQILGKKKRETSKKQRPSPAIL